MKTPRFANLSTAASHHTAMRRIVNIKKVMHTRTNELTYAGTHTDTHTHAQAHARTHNHLTKPYTIISVR